MTYVTLIDCMGSDLTVVNSARVSFNKVKIEMDNTDSRLVEYLAKNNHWSPFAHTCAQFHIRAPIFIARQLAKHQVGLVWNEISRRYVSDRPDVWSISEGDKGNYWRRAAEDKKQGSSDDAMPSQRLLNHMYEDACRHGVDAYKQMISMGVCPEQARAVLPQSAYTEWHWTGSVYAFSRVYNLRTADDAQKETKMVARKIGSLLKPAFPLSWEALTN